MNTNSAYTDLLGHLKETQALGQVAGLLHWDQEVMMPSGGADGRAEQSGAMQAVMHARRTDPRVSEWLAEIDFDALDPAGRANVRIARQEQERANKIPKDLAIALSRTTSKATSVWAQARMDNNFADFAATLIEVLNLTRQEAQCLSTDELTPYDALLNDYEIQTTEAEVAEIFGRLRQGLTDLRARIIDSGSAVPEIAGQFATDAQLAMARELATEFGYDWSAGRLDLTVHPFCSGTRGDTRITTRVDEADPFNCLYSTIHETGHSLYEQGLDPMLLWQPAGNSVSMGVHESQSRICENQIGRSAEYTGHLFDKMCELFGGIGINTARDFYRAVNRVAPGFIRTEADEVHYNLHIMMRFDLERALISGDLQVADLPGAWNDRFYADFEKRVPDDANGVLQDVHWSAGLFGYFPTYTLGNIYAGELWDAIGRVLPNRDMLVASAELQPIIDWLRVNIHRKGSIDLPRDVIANAVGHQPTEGSLLRYLEDKFSDLYQL